MFNLTESESISFLKQTKFDFDEAVKEVERHRQRELHKKEK